MTITEEAAGEGSVLISETEALLPPNNISSHNGHAGVSEPEAELRALRSTVETLREELSTEQNMRKEFIQSLRNDEATLRDELEQSIRSERALREELATEQNWRKELQQSLRNDIEESFRSDLESIRDEMESLFPNRSARQPSQTSEEEKEICLPPTNIEPATINDLKEELAKHDRMQESLRTELEAIRQSQQSLINERPDQAKENHERVLPQDTFSFMLVCHSTSIPFFFAIFVYLFQMTTFALVTLDLIRQGDGGNNPLGIPVDVSAELRAAQFIAILVAVFTQGDLMTGFGLFRNGYNEKFPELFEWSTYWKYWLSLIARLSEGCVGLVVSFLLIITADQVVELLLNFTAIEFVSTLDEVLFFLSLQGFMGKSCKRQATLLKNTTFVTNKRHNRAWKAFMLLTILLSILVGWVVISHNQTVGHYFCETLQVQFGDDFVPALGTFSGLYDLKQADYSFVVSQRVEYVERRSVQTRSKRGIFAYCTKFSAWTFYGEDTANASKSDPCENWVTRSASVDSFDLTDTATLAWQARDATGREVVLTPFYLSCFECNGEDDCGGRGTCSKSVCSCDEPWWGLRCEFEACSDIAVDSLNEPFASTRDWSEDFTFLFDSTGTVAEAYHRPVYIHDYGTSDFDIIVFTGRRWALTSVQSLPIGRTANISKDDLAFYFKHEFHAHTPSLFVSFLSEPADIGTPEDDASPVDLQWFRAQSSILQGSDATSHIAGKPISTVLLCRHCHNISNPCQYDGLCFNGTCQCAIGSTGVLCQGPPTGNGYCNPFFNTPEFKFDSGDCCETTCISSQVYRCGYDSSGLAFSGYPHCSGEQNIWLTHGDMIVGPPFSRSGSQVALSSDGGTLAIAEPGMNRVRLFDKEGSQWIERTVYPNTLPGTIHSLAISSGPGTLLNTPTFLAPVILGISGTESTGNSTASIYYCVIESCSLLSKITPALDVVISGDSSTIAIGLDVFDSPKNQMTPLDWMNPAGFLPKALEIREHLELSLEDFGYDPSQHMYFDTFGSTYNEPTAFVSAISTEGSRLAIQMLPGSFRQSCYGNGGPDFCEEGSALMTLTWNGTTYTKEKSMVFNLTYKTADALPIPSVSMSGDGNFILVTLDPFVDQVTLDWTHMSFVWTESGWEGRLDNTTTDCRDRTLSDDGSTLICELIDGSTTFFDWNGVDWEQVDRPLHGLRPVSLAVSSDGTVLVLGLPTSQINDAGSTVVYSRHRSLGANASILRVSYTPTINSTIWYVESNKSGDVIMKDTISDAWEIASGTETAIVEKSDCLVFTIYPGLPLCEDNEIGGCALPPSPYPLNPSRFDLFLDELHMAGNQFDQDQPLFLGGCGRVVYQPRRVWLGDCLTCTNSTERLQVMVHPCFPLEWEVSDSKGREKLSSEGFVEVPHWHMACVDLQQDCYTFSIALSGENDGRMLQAFLSKSAWFYSIFVGEDLVATNHTVYDIGQVEPQTISFGNCG